MIERYLGEAQSSVLWVSLVSFLTSSGLVYYLGIIFFVVAYKLRQEGLAEKQVSADRDELMDIDVRFSLAGVYPGE